MLLYTLPISIICILLPLRINGEETMGDSPIDRNDFDQISNILIIPNINDKSIVNGRVAKIELFIKEAHNPVIIGIFQQWGSNKYRYTNGYTFVSTSTGFHSLSLVDLGVDLSIQKRDVVGIYQKDGGSIAYSPMANCNGHALVRVKKNLGGLMPYHLYQMSALRGVAQRCREYSLRIYMESCPRGTMSVRGSPPCMLCPKGTYQPQVNCEKCFKCSHRRTTTMTGSKSIDDCRLVSPILIGDAARRRRHTGSNRAELIIPNINNKASEYGHIKKIEIYAKRPDQRVTLGVFRRITDDQYLYVGGYEHVTTRNLNVITLAPSQEIPIEVGDILGFFSEQGSSIMFNGLRGNRCTRRPLVRGNWSHYEPFHVNNIITIPTWQHSYPCRIYAFQAAIG